MKKNVLFLCTGNSARSILAEAILNRAGGAHFQAHSAGSKPTGTPNPLALELLRTKGYDTGFAASKSWHAFATADAPDIDIVITVCDSAANESCPVWPGKPVTAHWGIPDPAAVAGSADVRQAAFATAYEQLTRRIKAMLDLPANDLDPPALQAALRAIGRTGDAAEPA